MVHLTRQYTFEGHHFTRVLDEEKFFLATCRNPRIPSHSLANLPHSSCFNKIYFQFLEEPVYWRNTFPTRSSKNEMVRDEGKFLFITLRIKQVTYVTPSLLKTLLTHLFSTNKFLISTQAKLSKQWTKVLSPSGCYNR